MQWKALAALCLAVATTAGCAASVPVRVTAEPAIARPQEPTPPFPYRVEEVRIPNRVDGIYVAGTLTVPEGQGPFPAAVLINGSGAVTRANKANPYRLIADQLTRRGIAVLRVDMRGVGASGGAYWATTPADVASDVEAELAFLQKRSDIDAARVGLLGHSAGGMVAAMVAGRRPVAFLALLASPGLSGAEVFERQTVETLTRMGGMPKPDELAAMDAAAARLRTETEPARRATAVATVMQPLLRLAPDGEARTRTEAIVKSKILEMAYGPWYRVELAYDPRSDLKRVKAPVLLMNGAKDLLVSSEINVPAIRQALEEGGNRHVTVAVLPGLNHFFQHTETGALREMATTSEIMAPEAIAQLTDWVAAQTRALLSPALR